MPMTDHRVVVGIAVVFAGLGFAQITPAISAGGIVRGADGYDASFNGVARGSRFAVWGTNLAPSVASPTEVPLPTLLNGVRVRVVSGSGPEWAAPLLYVSPYQINAILPSAVPEGGQSVIVEVNGVDSAPAPIVVTTRQFAAFTSGNFGFGPARLQQVDSSGAWSFNSFRNPAAGGDAMVLWGTGLGPLPAGDDDAAAPGMVDLSADVTVYVGDMAVKPFYAGRAPANPGVDQINFYLPVYVPSRCYVPLTVVVGTVASGPLTFSAGAPGVDCSSEFGLSSAQVEALDAGGTVRAAVLSVDTEASYGQVEQTGEAWVGDYNLADLSLLATGWQSPAVQPAGHCEKSMSDSGPGPLNSPVVVKLSPLETHVHGGVVGWEGPPWFQLVGPGGCLNSLGFDNGIWRSSQTPSSCVAAAWGLFTFVGGAPVLVQANALPQPKQPAYGDWVTFTSQPDQSVLASWGLSSPSNDQLVLDLEALYDEETPPQIFREGTRSLVCALPPSSFPAAGNFVVSPDAGAFVENLPYRPSYGSGSIESVARSMQASRIPMTLIGTTPNSATLEVDFQVVVVRNGLRANAP
jgi:uncharacterized protein (TIGR03437 family)